MRFQEARLSNNDNFSNLISHFNLLTSRLPNVVQKCFCTPDEAMDATFQIKYVLAFADACSWRYEAKTAAHFF